MSKSCGMCRSKKSLIMQFVINLIIMNLFTLHFEQVHFQFPGSLLTLNFYLEDSYINNS